MRLQTSPRMSLARERIEISKLPLIQFRSILLTIGKFIHTFSCWVGV